MWFAGAINYNTAFIKFYFDGESNPRIHVLMKDIFSGKNAPFLAPLVGDGKMSSGGFFSYVPFPFSKSVKITTNAAGKDFFYHVGYHAYSPDTAVATWKSSEDSAAVRDLWNKAGTAPGTDSGSTTVSNTINLEAGQTQTLLDGAGPRSISSIKLRIPGVVLPDPIKGIEDDGRIHKGYSQFHAAIDPNNTGVTLKRRFNYSVPGQRAKVYVDDSYVGEWDHPGLDDVNKWRDSSFIIPSDYTSGKSSITVRIESGSSDLAWNEYHYWVYSTVSGSDVLTDVLDVGNTISENQHRYTTDSQSFSSNKTHTYPPNYATITENGRTHRGYSQFDMAIDPDNQGIKLTRRLDYGIGNQKANVYVDGSLVGEWFNSGKDVTYRWNDSSFYISKSFTSGKSVIAIKVEFVSSESDWTEYDYWVDNITGGPEMGISKIRTDFLDVGNPTSENDHNYTTNTQGWIGSQTYDYPLPSADVNDILNNIRLRIYWDNEENPSVDAPIGSFFGMGQFGPYGTRALPVGMDENNNLYVYFPMPFERNAKIQLVSSREDRTEGISYEIKHKPFTDSFANVAYFKTYFSELHPEAGDGSDYVVLDVDGTGQLVGLMQSMSGLKDRRYLEGDERIYVDGSKTPAYIGTGTEGSDLNFDNPQSTSANSATMDVSTLAYYYHKPNPSYVLVDTLDVGDRSSERKHSYKMNTQTWSGSLTGTYEGMDDDVVILDSGKAHLGFSEFKMGIPSSNQGIMLRRTFDQSIANQIADVYVDGSLVGKWYRAGSNVYHKWRDDDFIIPAAYTRGKTKITIKVVNASSTIEWGEFKYEAYSLNDSTGSKPVTDSDELTKTELLPSSDNFRGSTLGSQWSWVREDSTRWNLGSAPGSMRITGQAGDIYTTSTNAKNILLQNAPDGDFTITTHLALPAARLSDNFQQAGLIVYQDDDHYMKLVRIHSNGNSFEFGKEANGKAAILSVPDNISRQSVYLRITKIGDNYTAYYSINGIKYTRVAIMQSASLSSIKVGLIAFTSEGSEFNADFDHFNVMRPAWSK
jgi:regulation of enolase protein 1 (concanavalin A-like superfamily)